jgi:hypothetical protein
MHQLNNGFTINKSFKDDGESFGRFKEQLKEKITDSKSANHQIDKAKEVFACCLPSHSSKKKRVGLVIGRVQSGKTTSFTAVSALAADNKYAAVIHLLGTNLNLKEDNEADVAKYLELAGYDVDDSSFHVVKVAPSSRGGLTNNGRPIKEKDIASLMEVGERSDWDTRTRKTVYYPLLKNYTSIDLLQKHLKKVFINLEDPRPILIVDDEVDSYSLNTKSPDKKYKKDENEKATTTYKSLKKLYNTCEIVTYIGYTATAFAIMTAHSTSFLDPDFHVVIDPGKDYVGNEKIFGIPDVMKTPAQIKANIHPHQARELDILLYNPNTDKDEVDWDGLALDSMEDAVCDYLVSTIALMERRKADGTHAPGKATPTSMMLHPDRLTGKHRDIETALQKFLDNLELALQSINIAHPALIKLENAYTMRKTIIPNEHKKCFPSLAQVQLTLRDEILPQPRYSIHVLNADKLFGNNSIQRVDWKERPLHFCIGSVALSRGYVVDQLITTWMPNEPGTLTADVTEQRMRCFGYKGKFLDLISVYVQPGTLEMMRNYSYTEQCLMDDLKEAAITGHTIHDVAGSIHHITNLTAGNKIWRDSINKKISWAPSFFSQFDSKNKTCIHKVGFRNPIINFIKQEKSHFKSIGKNSIYGASTSAQVFSYATFKLDYVSKHLLDSLKPFIDDKDLLLKLMINEILPRHLQKNVECDVVLFNQPSRQLHPDCINSKINSFHLNANQPYTSGESLPYVGDRNVLSIGDYDPSDKYNYSKNSKFTIHIHKFHKINEYTGRVGPDGPEYLTDSYAMQIHTRGRPARLKIVQ